MGEWVGGEAERQMLKQTPAEWKPVAGFDLRTVLPRREWKSRGDAQLTELLRCPSDHFS